MRILTRIRQAIQPRLRSEKLLEVSNQLHRLMLSAGPEQEPFLKNALLSARQAWKMECEREDRRRQRLLKKIRAFKVSL